MDLVLTLIQLSGHIPENHLLAILLPIVHLNSIIISTKIHQS